MKYKKGDTVIVVTKFPKCYTCDNGYKSFDNFFGEIGKIIQVDNFNKSYLLDIDNGKHGFMENEIRKIESENDSDVKSPAEMLREIAIWVEMLNIKEFDIQCTDGVVNFNMAKNVEE